MSDTENRRTGQSHRNSKYCLSCGFELRHEVLEGKRKMRGWCARCGFVHYISPRVAAFGIPITMDDEVIMIRESAGIRRGWVFPGGFMEVDEHPTRTVIREAMEEAALGFGGLKLIGVYTRVERGVVVIAYSGKVTDCGPVPKGTEVGVFDRSCLPWDEITLDTSKKALRDLLGSES